MERKSVDEIMLQFEGFFDESESCSEELEVLLKVQDKMIDMAFDKNSRPIKKIYIEDVVSYYNGLNAKCNNVAKNELEKFDESARYFSSKIGSLISGQNGEKKMFFKLGLLDTKNILVTNIVLGDEDLHTEIDAIVITPKCVFIIEAKNMYGDVLIKEGGDLIKGKTLFCNLAEKMSIREIIVSKILKDLSFSDINIQCMTVFTNENCLFNNMSSQIIACNLNELIELIDYYDGEEIYDVEQMKDFANEIVEREYCSKTTIDFNIKQLIYEFATVKSILDEAMSEKNTGKERIDTTIRGIDSLNENLDIQKVEECERSVENKKEQEEQLKQYLRKQEELELEIKKKKELDSQREKREKQLKRCLVSLLDIVDESKYRLNRTLDGTYLGTNFFDDINTKWKEVDDYISIFTLKDCISTGIKIGYGKVYIADFTHLNNDIRDGIKRMDYSMQRSKKVNGNYTSNICDKNGEIVANVSLKKAVDYNVVLSELKSMELQLQMNEIIDTLYSVENSVNYLIDMTRDRNIRAIYSNAIDFLKKASTCKLEDCISYIQRADDMLLEGINTIKKDIVSVTFSIQNVSGIKENDKYLHFIIEDLQLLSSCVGLRYYILSINGDVELANKVFDDFRRYILSLYFEKQFSSEHTCFQVIHYYFPYKDENMNFWVDGITDMLNKVNDIYRKLLEQTVDVKDVYYYDIKEVNKYEQLQLL